MGAVVVEPRKAVIPLVGEAKMLKNTYLHESFSRKMERRDGEEERQKVTFDLHYDAIIALEHDCIEGEDDLSAIVDYFRMQSTLSTQVPLWAIAHDYFAAHPETIPVVLQGYKWLLFPDDVFYERIDRGDIAWMPCLHRVSGIWISEPLDIGKEKLPYKSAIVGYRK